MLIIGEWGQGNPILRIAEGSEAHTVDSEKDALEVKLQGRCDGAIHQHLYTN